MYTEEDPSDSETLYSITNLKINQEVSEQPYLLPHIHQYDSETGMGGAIAYDMAENLYKVWETDGYYLNPTDTTPCTFENFYAKLCSELANEGSVYKTMSESLKATRDQVESRRQEVLGVNADEELQSMIK
jgi:flagellar hook-associated protein 1 FlgK